MRREKKQKKGKKKGKKMQMRSEGKTKITTLVSSDGKFKVELCSGTVSKQQRHEIEKRETMEKKRD